MFFVLESLYYTDSSDTIFILTFDHRIYFFTSYFSTSLLSTPLLFYLSTCIFQHNPILVQSDPNLPQSKEKAGPGQSSQSGWNRNTQRDYPRSLEGTSLRKNKITSSFSQLLQYEGNYFLPHSFVVNLKLIRCRRPLGDP